MKIKTSKNQLGKDGKQFDPVRWIEWANNIITQPNLHFHKAMLDGSTGGKNSKNSRKGIKSECKICFELFNGGKQLNKHMKDKHSK